MSELVLYLVGLGTEKLITLTIVLLILLFSIHFTIMTVEPYARNASIGEIFQYGKYDVVTERDGIVQNVVTVKAWNKTNAIERVAREIETDGLTFHIEKRSE